MVDIGRPLVLAVLAIVSSFVATLWLSHRRRDDLLAHHGGISVESDLLSSRQRRWCRAAIGPTMVRTMSSASNGLVTMFQLSFSTEGLRGGIGMALVADAVNLCLS